MTGSNCLKGASGKLIIDKKGIKAENSERVRYPSLREDK